MRDGLELISFHYSQAWNCQFYDSHLISNVLSASSHHIKAGVTSFFTTLTQCRLFFISVSPWYWEKVTRKLREGFQLLDTAQVCSHGPVWMSSHLCSQLVSPGRISAIKGANWLYWELIAHRFLQPNIFTKFVHFPSQSRSCWGLQEQPASVRKNIQTRVLREAEDCFHKGCGEIV